LADSPDLTITDRLRAFATAFDREFERLLAADADVPPRLAEAMAYSALAPGKRVRPYVVCRAHALCGGMDPRKTTAGRDVGRRDQAWSVAVLPIAAAIECVHAFSLIHDDLPAMDDDDLRRGRPTNHVKFGEAMAILAGDALLALAFELVARDAPDGSDVRRMTLELARGAGWAGMIGGQAADVLAETEPPDAAIVDYIHTRKTARLFQASARLGSIAAAAPDATIDALGRYGLQLGRAFQIADDLLDVTASSEQIGKATGKDASAGKQTYPRCVSIAETRRLAARAAADAIAALDEFGPAADDLRALARFVVDREA